MGKGMDGMGRERVGWRDCQVGKGLDSADAG